MVFKIRRGLQRRLRRDDPERVRAKSPTASDAQPLATSPEQHLPERRPASVIGLSPSGLSRGRPVRRHQRPGCRPAPLTQRLPD